jgi:hypothetical protein
MIPIVVQFLFKSKKIGVYTLLLIEIACLDFILFYCQVLVLQAFLSTWDLACAVKNGAMNVPSGYDFLVYPTIFNGSNCSSNLQLQVGVDLLFPKVTQFPFQ